MTDEQAPDSSRLELAAALLASSVIGVPVVITTAVRTFLSVINPRGIDAARLGAYELETIGTFALAALGTIVAVVLVFSRLKAQAGSRAVLRVPYMILALQIVFAAVTVAFLVFTPV